MLQLPVSIIFTWRNQPFSAAWTIWWREDINGCNLQMFNNFPIIFTIVAWSTFLVTKGVLSLLILSSPGCILVRTSIFLSWFVYNKILCKPQEGAELRIANHKTLALTCWIPVASASNFCHAAACLSLKLASWSFANNHSMLNFRVRSKWHCHSMLNFRWESKGHLISSAK